ncbi:DUF4190 domain-containing protein [Paenibacillus guangzhouensis]|uniref:DUF4190 domain-containing protein n=1 Tax=Paenibacillus guangzhouensis TaxID=1473112 RepID=UPI001D11BE90|nr:DUF4190 domain-containing protein [Paenibacillus guangzhouensis]
MDPIHTPPHYQHYPPVRKTNSKSIAALVLGILGVVVPYLGFIIAIIAIVFSRLAAGEIKRTGEEGRGMATAGLVLGIVGTVLYGIIILLAVIAFLAFAASDVTTF